VGLQEVKDLVSKVTGGGGPGQWGHEAEVQVSVTGCRGPGLEVTGCGGWWDPVHPLPSGLVVNMLGMYWSLAPPL
jgi:hypothetical protein